MGSDRAPKPEVEGAILACRHYDVQVLLVGREAEIREELKREIEKHPTVKNLPIDVVHATEAGLLHARWVETRSRGACCRIRNGRQHRRRNGYRQNGSRSLARR